MDRSSIRLPGSREEARRLTLAPTGAGVRVNRVQKFREAALMAKAELARRAGVSESTIDRVESGHDCRMETKRKILFALGLTLHDGRRLFPPRNGARAARSSR